jgi:tetratricopeptide (TPR) repeat protein
VHEFVKTLDASSCDIVKASASLQGTNTPYLLIREALRSWCGVTDESSGEEVADHIAQKLDQLGGIGSQTIRTLQMLAGVPAEPAGWSELEASARRHLIFAAVTDGFLAAAKGRPLLFWLEDLQWADSESLGLLNTLSPQIASSQLLILATYRPDRALLERPHTLIRLTSLERWAADMLLRELVGPGESIDELRTLVLDRVGGIPFFIEELILNLVESGELRGDPGAYELCKALTDLTIPDSVQAVIAARVDRLAPHLKLLLQAAAVLGPSFRSDRLKDLSARSEGEISAALHELQAAHFILQSASADEERYEFVHALTHEVAYEGLPLRTRQQLHGEAFKALRHGGEDMLSVEELAHHAERAALWSDAVPLLRKAGTKALAFSAYRDAHVFFERALRALGHLPESSSAVEEGIDIRLDLRTTFGATGEYDRMQVCLDEAESLASSIHDHRRLGTVYVAQTLAYNLRGELDKSLERGGLAKQLAKDTGDDKLELISSLYLAQAHMWRGNFRSLLDILEPNTGWIEGPLRYERMVTTSTSSVLWKGMIAASHAYLGSFESAIRAGQEACAIAREGRRPYDIALSSWYVGFVYSHRGDFESALSVLREAFNLCTANRLQFLYPVVSTSLGYAYAQAGRNSEGVELLSRALTLVRNAKFYYAEAWSSIYLGYAKIWSGSSQEALTLSREALLLARTYGYRAVEAAALRLRGDAGTAAGQSTKDCEEAYIDSLAISAELMLRPDESRAKKALSLLYDHLERKQEAEVFRRSAIQTEGQIGLS